MFVSHSDNEDDLPSPHLSAASQAFISTQAPSEPKQRMRFLAPLLGVLAGGALLLAYIWWEIEPENLNDPMFIIWVVLASIIVVFTAKETFK